MKFIAYAVRPDEQQAFDQFGKQYNCTITKCSDAFSPKTAHLTENHDSVIFIGNCNANREALEIVSNLGITYVSTRSAGFNNIDLDAARKLGIQVANVPAYSPHSVAEFTVLSALSMIRNYPIMLQRTAKQNYSLGGLIGQEIRNMTLGFIGTGRIGKRTIESFFGLNPKKVLAYDPYPNPDLTNIVEYVSMDQLLTDSSIISFHTNLTDENYHIINKDSLSKMKDGIYIINTSRGGLIDAEAILEALDSGKVGGLATDVYEHEVGLLHANLEGKAIEDPIFKRLHEHPRVIVSPHYAFYTDEAVSNMVEYSIQNILEYKNTNQCKNTIK